MYKRQGKAPRPPPSFYALSSRECATLLLRERVENSKLKNRRTEELAVVEFLGSRRSLLSNFVWLSLGQELFPLGFHPSPNEGNCVAGWQKPPQTPDRSSRMATPRPWVLLDLLRRHDAGDMTYIKTPMRQNTGKGDDGMMQWL